MSFLSPLTIAIAAGLTIPPLVALYFLKLKRRVETVPTTLLWKRAVADLRVNAPFQRLRASILLFLQLLVLIIAAFALGKPMMQRVATYDDALILLIDRSASMNVVEADGRTRLEIAKAEAKKCLDNLGPNAQAMVISFCDIGSVVAPFDADRGAIAAKIDSIEPTQSASRLSEALRLAEAYSQDTVIGGEAVGSNIETDINAPPAKVFMFSDGRIEDAAGVALEKFDISKITMVNVAKRSDNVGILSMDARRNHERPEFLEVVATVANFDTQPKSFDAVLYVEGRHTDVKTVQLPAATTEVSTTGQTSLSAPAMTVLAFDDLEFEGGGVVELSLRVQDALSADDRAWAVVSAPRKLRILQVSADNPVLDSAIRVLPVDATRMTPEEYEAADEKTLMEGKRSAFDVVILDRHSTSRLPTGNYLFWEGVPKIDGVEASDFIKDEVIFNWDDTHPILRYVGIETLDVVRWRRLKLPPEAVAIVEGESSPVISYLTRGANQYLISAFSLVFDDGQGQRYNTDWTVSVDFVVFMHNAINFLAGNISGSQLGILPGEPITLPLADSASEVTIVRPDKVEEVISSSGNPSVHYARTRLVGPYQVRGGQPPADRFAVNLFNETESHVAPAPSLTLGSENVSNTSTTVPVDKPAWQYLLLAVLALLLIEWVVYNFRVFI